MPLALFGLTDELDYRTGQYIMNAYIVESKNGTFLNGRRIERPSILNDGDQIWIGRSVARLSFLIEGEPTQTEHSVT